MKRKLFLLLCTLLGLLSSVQGVKAYTVSDLTSAGWTQVMDMSSVTLANNYFIFVDGQEGKYSMVNAMPKGILTHVARPMYQEIADPTSDFCQVWSIENYDAENYAIKNNSDDYYLNSNGAYWSSHVSGDYGVTSRMKIISIGEGKYRLQTTGTSTFWGPYKDGGGSIDFETKEGMDFEEGADDLHYAAIAANKNEANAPGFYIYSIARTTFNAVCRRASTLDSEGWTKVTETEGLGKSGYYYVFLDASENGGESGFAMTGTGGRPQYKLGKNPIEDRTQLWTTEKHGSGYAIKNVKDDKYIYCRESWDMQETDNINTNNTDFIPAVSDGKWTLSNSISTGEFVGNYKNSPYNPTDGEELAANKASRKGKRTFLIYSIPTIAGVATELPGSGSMEADKWYYFTTTTAGDYGFSAVDGVILTANGDQAVSVATGDPLTQVKALNASTTYYIKSETAQTVTKSGPYTYTIGTAASDKVYVQPGNTVTVSYGSMATTNTYASEISTAITGVTLGGEPISVTRTTKGFTFTVPEVTKGANYTLSIPANIIGYDAPGSGKNEAQEITLKVPVATEGTYYLSTVIAGQRKWLNKNGSGYTYAYDQGLPFTLERNEGSVDTYKLKFSEGNYLNDVGSNWQTKIEGSKNDDWKLQAEDGGYKLLLGVNNDCQLFIQNTETGLIEITHSTNDGNVWEFVAPDDYTNFANLVDVNAKITAIGDLPYADSSKKPSTYNATSSSDAAAHAASLTTELRAYVESNALAEGVDGATDYTGYIQNATCPGPKTDSDKEYSSAAGWDLSYIRFDGGSGWTGSETNHDVYYGSNGYFWGNFTGSRTVTMTQVVSDLPAGRYLLTVRAKSSGAIPTFFISGNGVQQNITHPNGVFGNGWDDNSVTFTVGNSCQATILLKAQKESDGTVGHWFNADNFRLVRLGDATVSATIGSAGWTTFASPYALNLNGMTASEGDVKAYYASSMGDGKVTMTSTSQVGVQAGEGLMLKGNAGATITIPIEPSGTSIDGNKMKGCLVNTEITSATENYATFYVLVNGTDGAEFQNIKKYCDGGQTVTVPAGKAYLDATALAGARLTIVFNEDGFTGINAVEAAEAETGALKDGKYLINGKIVLVKNGVKYGANGQKLN